MLTLKLRTKNVKGLLFWEPYIRLSYGIGWRKYDMLVDVGLSEKTPCGYFKILLSRKLSIKLLTDIPKSFVRGYIQEPLKTDAETILGELLSYAKMLHFESKRVTRKISDYAKKLHLWSKYMAYPIDEGAKWILKILRPQKFDKQGIFMVKALLNEGFGINEKTSREQIKLFKDTGSIIYCPFYVIPKKERIVFYDGTENALKENVIYTRFINSSDYLKNYIESILRKI